MWHIITVSCRHSLYLSLSLSLSLSLFSKGLTLTAWAHCDFQWLTSLTFSAPSRSASYCGDQLKWPFFSALYLSFFPSHSPGPVFPQWLWGAEGVEGPLLVKWVNTRSPDICAARESESEREREGEEKGRAREGECSPAVKAHRERREKCLALWREFLQSSRERWDRERRAVSCQVRPAPGATHTHTHTDTESESERCWWLEHAVDGVGVRV